MALQFLALLSFEAGSSGTPTNRPARVLWDARGGNVCLTYQGRVILEGTLVRASYLPDATRTVTCQWTFKKGG